MFKKITILGILFFMVFFFSSNLYAQNIGIGFKGGLNLSDASIDPSVPDSKTRLGAIIGGLVEIKVANIFYIQPEVWYIMKGISEEGNIYGYDYTATVKLDYIQIPVYGKLKFDIDKSPFKPYLFAGPSIGFNVNSKAKIEVNGQEEEEDIKDEIESIDFALDLGAGGAVVVAKKVSIFGEVLYGFGLTDVSKSSSVDWKNNGFKFNLGVIFGI